MRKRLLSALLALCMVLALLPGRASAAGTLTDHNVPDTVQWSFPSLSGGTVTQDTYSGKIQVLILFRASGICWNSNSTISSLANAGWAGSDGVQVIAVGCGEDGEDAQTVRANVDAFKQAYAPNCGDIEFCYGTSTQLWNTLRQLQPLVGGVSNSVTYAVNYVFDQENHLRFSWQGSYRADYYQDALDALADAAGPEPGGPEPGGPGSEPDPEEPGPSSGQWLDTASMTDNPAVSNNISAQNYTSWSSSTIQSYLYENESGGLTRVEYIPASSDYVYRDGGWVQTVTEARIVVEEYSSSFEFRRGQSLPVELELWGGFIAGETYNFLIFGQKNKEDSSSKEVIRIVKYSKNWQRLGQASLYGVNTSYPFIYGTLRAAEYGGELYIRTCHEMYTSSDGRNHQANLTIAVRESDMTVLDSYYVVSNNSYGYVSHSFNQFVLIDQQQRIVTLDHGDASPRGAVLMVYSTKAGNGQFSGRVSKASVQDFASGSSVYQRTGASLGGLAETNRGYVAVYNYDGQGSSTTSADRSVYFAYVSKDDLQVTVKTVSGAGAMTPVLAPTGLDGGYILWNTSDSYGRATSELRYAAYSDGGGVGGTMSATASLSDCQPILYNGKVVWYTTQNTVPTFYQLDGNGVASVQVKNVFTVSVEGDASGGGTVSGGGRYFEGTAVQAAAVPYENYKFAGWYENGVLVSSDAAYSFPAQRSATLTAKFVLAFADVSESDWFYEGVAYAVQNSLMRGTSTTAFAPSATANRAMVVTMLYRLEQSPDAGSAGFNDVAPGEWYADAVAWASASGIVNGYSNGNFGPDDSITREQLAAILYRYAEYKGYDVNTSAGLSGYADAAAISDWALTAMRWANSQGLINGRTASTLVPGGTANRAEAATILMRFCQDIAGPAFG